VPIEGQVLSNIISTTDSLRLIFRFGTIIFSTLYFIFSLIVVRQVNLMNDTLITKTSPLLRALAIIHAGFALGIIVLFIGLLFE